MVKIGVRRYNKLLTVRSRLRSLMDDFDSASRDVLLNNGNGSCYYQLSIALAALDKIFREV